MDRNNKLVKLLLFGGLGIFTFVFNIATTWLLTEVIGLHYSISYAIVLVLIIIIGFVLNIKVVFQSNKGYKSKLIKYTIVYMLTLGANYLLVKLLTEVLHIYYLLSIAVITIVLFFVKFFCYDRAVFEDRINKNIPGNYYNKHQSKNILVKYLMKRFHQDLFLKIKETNSKTLLDVGCGEGYTTQLTKKKFPNKHIEGSELEGEAIRKAREENKDILFTQESIYSLQRKDSSFDLMLATEVLEHLEEPDKAIEEVKRVSKEYCIFSVPSEPLWRIANILRGAYWKDLGNTPGHIQHWNKRSFHSLLKKHFKEVEMRRALLWNIALCKK